MKIYNKDNFQYVRDFELCIIYVSILSKSTIEYYEKYSYGNNIVVLLIDNETHTRTYACTHAHTICQRKDIRTFWDILYIPILNLLNARARI